MAVRAGHVGEQLAVLRNGGTNADPVLRGMFGFRLNRLTYDGIMVGACPCGPQDGALDQVISSVP